MPLPRLFPYYIYIYIYIYIYYTYTLIHIYILYIFIHIIHIIHIVLIYILYIYTSEERTSSGQRGQLPPDSFLPEAIPHIDTPTMSISIYYVLRILCSFLYLHPVSITRFPLRRFSPGAGLRRNPFFHR